MAAWPPLPVSDWIETRETVHLFTQVAGKLKLAHAPFVNQWWSVALQLTGRGLTTGLIPDGAHSVEVSFDFVGHRLNVLRTDGESHGFALEPMSVAAFYDRVTGALRRLDVDLAIDPHPAEVDHPVPFSQDRQHAAYDSAAVRRWWEAMVSVERVIQRFRSGYEAKSSPILFYWGGFDLNHSRFTGRRIPQGDDVGVLRRFAENEENFAIGFWPGSREAPQPVLYAYASPAPAGVESALITPDAAQYVSELGEFVLPYETLRSGADPDADALSFFESTYLACAALAGWDRGSLEGPTPSTPAERPA